MLNHGQNSLSYVSGTDGQEGRSHSTSAGGPRTRCGSPCRRTPGRLAPSRTLCLGEVRS